MRFTEVKIVRPFGKDPRALVGGVINLDNVAYMEEREEPSVGWITTTVFFGGNALQLAGRLKDNLPRGTLYFAGRGPAAETPARPQTFEEKNRAATAEALQVLNRPSEESSHVEVADDGAGDGGDREGAGREQEGADAPAKAQAAPQGAGGGGRGGKAGAAR